MGDLRKKSMLFLLQSIHELGRHSEGLGCFELLMMTGPSEACSMFGMSYVPCTMLDGPTPDDTLEENIDDANVLTTLSRYAV